MKRSAKNKLKGKIHELKGNVKEKAGKITRNSKLEKKGKMPSFGVSFSDLNTSYETILAKMIGKFDIQVEDAAKNLSPKIIARYCYDLAVAFNTFYEHVKVLTAESEALVNARLCLVYSFKETLDKALSLLGIDAPERM